MSWDQAIGAAAQHTAAMRAVIFMAYTLLIRTKSSYMRAGRAVLIQVTQHGCQRQSGAHESLCSRAYGFNLPLMSYSKIIYRRSLLAVITCLALHAGAAMSADEGVVTPQHEDHGVIEPVVKGTGSAFCQSGVSSGFACSNVEMLARLPLSQIGGGSGSDSWGWKDPATNRYYALMARSNGTSFVDVTDPAAPVYRGNLPSTSGNAPWRDVKVYANHAFIVADGISGHGMQVFDLTRLRGVTAPQTFAADALYTGIGKAHNVAINTASGYAYIVGSTTCSGGLHMVDVRVPKSPVFAGCFSGDGYTHDVQCANYDGPDLDHQGAEVCFGANEDSLTVIDVSNKAAPVMLGKAVYPNTAYSHQGWLSEDQALFFMGDEIDELTFGMNTRTLIFDVRDLDDPVFATAHAHATSVIDHNMYVVGDYLYQANYEAGLRILRIDRNEGGINLTEVAYFDTKPESDIRDFDGAWNVYPFFDNGTILVSDMSNGLYILQADLAGSGPQAGSPLNGSTSGAWIADGLNDQGIMLYVSDTPNGPVVFYTWFLFLDGEPFWLTGAASFEPGDDEVDIPTQRLSGLDFLVPGNDTALRENIGTLNIHVHGCDELHVLYDFAGLGSDELEFHRLAGVEGRSCVE